MAQPGDWEPLESPNRLDPLINDGIIQRPDFRMLENGDECPHAFSCLMQLFVSGETRGFFIAVGQADSKEQAKQNAITYILEHDT